MSTLLNIEHCPGKDNELPDALTRFSNLDEPSPGEPDLDRMVLPIYPNTEQDMLDTTPVVHAINPPLSLFEEVAICQQEDEELNQSLALWLESREKLYLTIEKKKFIRNHKADKYGFQNLSTDGTKWLFLVPSKLRKKIINDYYDKPLAGHPGAEETLRSIEEYFIWRRMGREIRRYVTGCHLYICCKPI